MTSPASTGTSAPTASAICSWMSAGAPTVMGRTSVVPGGSPVRTLVSVDCVCVYIYNAFSL